jgi:hypothetical protein
VDIIADKQAKRDSLVDMGTGLTLKLSMLLTLRDSTSKLSWVLRVVYTSPVCSRDNRWGPEKERGESTGRDGRRQGIMERGKMKKNSEMKADLGMWARIDTS